MGFANAGVGQDDGEKFGGSNVCWRRPMTVQKKIPADQSEGRDFHVPVRSLQDRLRRLSFRELEALTSFLQAVFLTFNHAVVTSQVTGVGQIVVTLREQAL